MARVLGLFRRNMRLTAVFTLSIACIILFVIVLSRPRPWQVLVDQEQHSEDLRDPRPDDNFCALRFGKPYLHAFAGTDYCDPESTARLWCFSHKTHAEKTNSFCLGWPATFHSSQQTFQLDCAIPHLDHEDNTKGLPQFVNFPLYWNDTGPRFIFQHYTHLFRNTGSPPSPEDVEGVSIRVKRESNRLNIWHTFMEIMSTTMSLDILRLAQDPHTERPFLTDEQVAKSQVVILDEDDDGPYYDLWSLLTNNPPVRLHQFDSTVPTRLVVPLPGSANPFWQGDWADHHCGESTTLRTFSRRILDLYDISDSAPRKERPLKLTMIDRREKRRLVDQEAHFAALRTKYPSIDIQLVDFAAMPLKQQIQTARSTDILVGVHGAGLTHGMFLAPNSAIVEIKPPTVHHEGFELMAQALGHRYFESYARELRSPNTTGDWHEDDV